MRKRPQDRKVLSLPAETSAANQDMIEEVIQPKSPSLELLSQRWQKIRLLILQELAEQSSRG